MWGQFTPGSKASPEVTPEGKNCTGASQIVGKRGLTRLRCRTLTLEAERHCLCRALSWNHLCRRQVAPRNARWRLRSRTCTLVVAGQITGLRTAGELGAVAGKRFPRSIVEPRRRERAQQAAFSAPTGNLASPWQLTAPARQIRPSHLIRLKPL